MTGFKAGPHCPHPATRCRISEPLGLNTGLGSGGYTAAEAQSLLGGRWGPSQALCFPLLGEIGCSL